MLAAVADAGDLATLKQRCLVGEVADQQQRWQPLPPDEQRDQAMRVTRCREQDE